MVVERVEQCAEVLPARAGPGELVFQRQFVEAVEAGHRLQALHHVQQFVRLVGGVGDLRWRGLHEGGGDADLGGAREVGDETVQAVVVEHGRRDEQGATVDAEQRQRGGAAAGGEFGLHPAQFAARDHLAVQRRICLVAVRGDRHRHHRVGVGDGDAAFARHRRIAVPAQQCRGEGVHGGVVFADHRAQFAHVGGRDRGRHPVEHLHDQLGAVDEAVVVLDRGIGDHQVQADLEALVHRMVDGVDGDAFAGPARRGVLQPAQFGLDVAAVEHAHRHLEADAGDGGDVAADRVAG